MGAINFRHGYEFDPDSYADSGGLPEKLRRQGIDLGSPPHGVSERVPDSFAGLQGGQLVRLFTTQAEQTRYQPGQEGSRPAPFVPRDANFRQLSRIPADRIARVTSPPLRGNEPTNPDSRPTENSFSLSLSEGASDDTFDTRAAHESAPSIVPVGWRARGIPNRASPSRPLSEPWPIQTLPEWWITAAKIGQLLFRGMYGNAGDGRRAYGRCIRASEGSVDDWEDFCRFLGRAENNTVGGESQNRACWGKTFQSENEKRQWCENQFGNR
jgi:hypothetical protein